MDTLNATSAFHALALETRLEAFRLLVKHGIEGLPAGEIAQALEVPHNTLSSHLAILVQAQLISFERQGRSVIYRVNFDGTRALLSFLMEDCCQGRADVCAPLIDSILAPACTPAAAKQ